MRRTGEGISPSPRQLPLYHKISSPHSRQVQFPSQPTAQMQRVNGLIGTSKHARTIQVSSSPPPVTHQHWQQNLDLHIQSQIQPQYTHIGCYSQRARQPVANKDAFRMTEVLRQLLEDRILAALTAIRDHTPSRPLRQRIPTHYPNTPLELTHSIEKYDSQYVARALPTPPQKEGANMLKGWVEFHYLMQMSGVMRTLQRLTQLVHHQDQSLNNTNHQILDQHWHPDYSPMHQVSLSNNFPTQQEAEESLVETMQREDRKQMTISTQSKMPASVPALPLSNRQSAIDSQQQNKIGSRISQESNILSASPRLTTPQFPKGFAPLSLQTPLHTHRFTYEHLLPSQQPAKPTDRLCKHSRPDEVSDGARHISEATELYGLRKGSKIVEMEAIKRRGGPGVSWTYRQIRPQSPPIQVHINSKPNSPLVRSPMIQVSSSPNCGTQPPLHQVYFNQQIQPNSPPSMSVRQKVAIVVTPPKRQPGQMHKLSTAKPFIQIQQSQQQFPIHSPCQRRYELQRNRSVSPKVVFNENKQQMYQNQVQNLKTAQLQRNERPCSPFKSEYQLERPVHNHQFIPRPQSPPVREPPTRPHSPFTDRYWPAAIPVDQQIRNQYFAGNPSTIARPVSILPHRQQTVAFTRPTLASPNIRPPPQRHSSLAHLHHRPLTPAPTLQPLKAGHGQPHIHTMRSDIQSPGSSKLSRPHSMTSKLHLTLKNNLS